MHTTISSTCMLAMLSFGIAAYAQTTGQNPTQPPSQAGSSRMEQPRQEGDRAQTQQQITLVGCVQSEADYRSANASGRGGAMGSGLGVGNEFVLINASIAPASGSQTAMSGSPTQPGSTASGTATGTSGTATPPPATGTAAGTTGTTPSHTEHSGMAMASGGTAYSLTGDRERELEKFVGQRVEIIGRLDQGGAGSGYGASGTTASGTATGSTATGTSGTATGSASAGASASAGDKLKEVDVVSFRAIGGTCPAK